MGPEKEQGDGKGKSIRKPWALFRENEKCVNSGASRCIHPAECDKIFCILLFMEGMEPK
jgi:hypothetical protein